VKVVLNSSDFSGFFRAIHGRDPFPWQQRLVDILAQSDEWPTVLDLPTGTGKTAALDAAVFHLALRAEKPGKAALRIAFVVDRRIVVDDTFARAERIASALVYALNGNREGFRVVKEVARRLKRLAGKGGSPLVARRLRGGVPLEHDWARTPTQPTILCSTVDQVGSRLLFRGYGVSDRMKPVHAGLLGTDSLILLDEAHLSEPFYQTLNAARRIGDAKINMAVLSATPGTEAVQPFTLSQADRDDPELQNRLEARKPAMLKPPVRGETDTVVAKVFANEARALMARMPDQDVSPPAIGIIVNRVALARAIYEELAIVPPDNDEPNGCDVDTILLTGRSRSVDRDAIVDKLDPFRTGADERGEAQPLFVVATQCLEVGVDLDLDGLVTQAASLDALRQRFGRLNRAGRPVCTKGVILALAKDVAKNSNDPVYGDRIRKTWEALKIIADKNEEEVDFGIEAFPASFENVGIDPNDLAAERMNAPVAMPAYFDLWSQTSPRPAADPEVSLFLHGAKRMTGSVSLVWRSDISEADLVNQNEDNLSNLVRLVPPRSAETIEVPLWTARTWLSQTEDVPDDMSDAPEREPDTQRTARYRRVERRAFRWAGPDDPRTGVVGLDELKIGDLLIVPSEYGGCDRFGWAPDYGDTVSDVFDKAAEPYRGQRFAIRIARGIVQPTQWDHVLAVLASEGTDIGNLVDSLIEALPPIADEHEGDGRLFHDTHKLLEALRLPNWRISVHFPYSGGRAGGAVIVADRRITSIPATEDDATSHTSTKPVLLDDHGRRVARLAEHFARTLGLEATMTNDLRLAAFLHDAGKADPRFQVMLSGGNLWNRPTGQPLAKSGRQWSPSAWTLAGLPKGWRHEALSVRMALTHPRFAEAHDSKLVLWLIGSHHGLGRPFFNFSDPHPEHPSSCLGVADWWLSTDRLGPQSLAFDIDGVDWPSLYENLKRRYGIWGLAHLEAILRLADHRASEEEQEI